MIAWHQNKLEMDQLVNNQPKKGNVVVVVPVDMIVVIVLLCSETHPANLSWISPLPPPTKKQLLQNQNNQNPQMSGQPHPCFLI